MDIKLSCYACGQHLVVDSSVGGSTVNCPSCQTELIVPEVVVTEPRATQLPPPIPPPPKTIVQPVYIQSPPQRQKSVGWGVFWGLFGFFIILPLVLIAVLVLGGMGTVGHNALERGKKRADAINSINSTNKVVTNAPVLVTPSSLDRMNVKLGERWKPTFIGNYQIM